ncbi:hypothetical protein GCM10018980_51820 [Streptomyces capoamus]|uniref:Uncharacterized protein n=1 Tax=Streptomyces capoamus TaxID=68183 RepID=A0A919EZM3_9ACTN|nr:hypothetical protein [Streptomyces capoamus]GGW15754.1 hypothetical protein GCM10010501_28990 [Streptomyces libani subsp. rufus]GHG62139.1 hypothetical protein GCM10018980_51820 [Streptomyces capoamus]
MAARKTTTSSKPADTEQAKGEDREQLRQRQFPAKAGAPEVEVDERSADGAEGTRHVKEFIVRADRWTGEDYQHEANRAAVTNEAIQRGLHPRGGVSFDGQEEHPDGKSLVLTYSVETVPSSVDHAPEDTTTPRDVIEADGKDTSSSKSEG